MIMKKQIISLGMMLAAAFTLINCTKDIENPDQQPQTTGYPFEITASPVDVKTVNEGMATAWASGDQINLFHAVGGTTDYKNDNAFTLKDAESGKFEGNLEEALDPQKEYDWYALYPYKKEIPTPGQHTTQNGYTYIGYSTGLKQTGYNSMASLKGTVCPLYGVLKACPAETTPSIEMKHLSSVVAINVTNANEESLTVETASLTAEEDIVGSYYFDLTTTPVTYNKSSDNYVFKTATVNVTSSATALAQGESAVLYLAIKPFTAATGSKLVLSVNGYEKELTMTKDVTFTAGKIKTLNFSYDKPATSEPEATSVTWDLSKDQTSEATTSKIAWTSDFVEMWCEKNNAGTATNNYYGGANNRTSTRFYKDSKLTIAPVSGSVVISAAFKATSDSYASAFENSTWTNASVSLNDKTITITPTDGTQNITALISGTCGFTSVVVEYAPAEGYVPPVLESIAVSGDYKTEFIQGSAFSFDGVVTATYDNGSTKNVTADCEFTGYDLEQLGGQTVTVSYEDKTTTYDITVEEKQQGSVELKTFTVKSDDVVSNSTYQAYSSTIDGRGWIITCGGNNKSVGVNKNNRSKCTLSSYSKYAVSPVTTSSTASAFASTTSISNVSKISYAALSGGSNHSSTQIYVLYSADGTTFSQLTLTKGTQGATISTTAGEEYEFDSCSGYFAVVFVATNTSGSWRLDDVNLTLTYSN